MLQEAPKVAVAMVSLAMVALLISLARNLVKELVKKETTERVAFGEELLPDLLVLTLWRQDPCLAKLSWSQERNQRSSSFTLQVLLPQPASELRAEDHGSQKNLCGSSRKVSMVQSVSHRDPHEHVMVYGF